MRDRERQRHRLREKQAGFREPDAELDPRTPGSCPGLKAGIKPLSHPGIPGGDLFEQTFELRLEGQRRDPLGRMFSQPAGGSAQAKAPSLRS